MHIGFRTSGGRGEYEVVGGHSGYVASNLEEWGFHLKWPDGVVRDTGLWLDPATSGKPRLRSLLKPAFQIGRAVSAMLLLPDPTRSFKATPNGWPIIRQKEYSVTQIGFAPETEFSPAVNIVTIVPSWIEVSNQGDSEPIGVEARWNRIVRLYGSASDLPVALASALRLHREIIAGGETVDTSLVSAVRDIMNYLARNPSSNYEGGRDPLSTLERLVGIQVDTDLPTLPPPDEIGEEEPEISARSAEVWRLAKSRGAGGRRFSQLVRDAYKHRCAFCGGKFGGVEGIRSGIDAAHILAWSKHDLDRVSNGIALCKLHHWAFDAGIMSLAFEGGDYYARRTHLARRLDSDTLDLLGADRTLVSPDRLPNDPNDRPDPKYLNLLYADLGISFSGAD